MKNGFIVNKIPSEVPLVFANKVIVANQLSFCFGYQQEEFFYYKDTMFIDSTQQWLPELFFKTPINILKSSSKNIGVVYEIGFFSSGNWLRDKLGDVDLGNDDLKNENVEALKKGLVNLQRHIENVKKFGLPVAIAVNHFIKDTDNEVKALIEFCDTIGVKASLCTHWANGGEGTKELASHVAELCEKNEDKFKFLYESKTPLFKKIETIAKEIYRADEVIADTKIRDQLKSFEDAGYGDFPICIAKTQYSFSTDPSLKGAPTGHALPIREIKLSSGAEFIVVICGAVMTMPGLPRVPAADSIKLNKDGEIEGLF